MDTRGGDTVNIRNRQSQARTVPNATRHGETWTTDEMDFVISESDATDEEIAYVLGRTLYAVWGMRHDIANGRTHVASERMRTRKPLAYDTGWTTIPQDW